MPRKKKDPEALAAYEASPLEAKPKPKRKAPIAVSAQLQHAIDKAGLIPATDVLQQLEPATRSPTPAQRYAAEEPPLPEPTPAPEPVKTHVQRVTEHRPAFMPVPEGFRNVSRHEGAGIKVNRGVDRALRTLGTAALQFAEDRPLSRATEYDLMEEAQNRGFQYKEARRQWERKLPDGMPVGQNTIEADALAKTIAKARGVGRGR